MTTTRKISIYCLFSWLALVTQYLPCYAQPELDPGKWVKELADKDPKKNEAAKFWPLTFKGFFVGRMPEMKPSLT